MTGRKTIAEQLDDAACGREFADVILSLFETPDTRGRRR